MSTVGYRRLRPVVVTAALFVHLPEANAQVPGRCCLDGECVLLTRSACEAAGGLSTGSPGTTCNGVTSCRYVGCCLLDGGCVPTTLVECFFTGMGGITYIEDESCPAGACPLTGACCYRPFWDCQLITEQICSSRQGVYQGDGSDCSTCEVLQACCHEGACEDVHPTDCYYSGSYPAGEGTACATYYCPVPGDFDADQDVDLTDFAVLFDCFAGPGLGDEGCVEFDEDYDVDLYDLYGFQNAFSGPPEP